MYRKGRKFRRMPPSSCPGLMVPTGCLTPHDPLTHCPPKDPPRVRSPFLCFLNPGKQEIPNSYKDKHVNIVQHIFPKSKSNFKNIFPNTKYRKHQCKKKKKFIASNYNLELNKLNE